MGRSPCCDKNGLKKGPWMPEEDLKLVQYIEVHGASNWRTLPKDAGLQRCGKSCRLRWINYLRPDIKRGRLSFEEEETIIQLHSVLGNKWSAIAARLPGRTDNEIKNYWNTHIRKRLLRMGINPVTHTPRLDLLDLSSLLSSSAQLNLSSLLGLQTLVNPELLRLVSTLLSSNQENPEILLENLQENQLRNAQIMQNKTNPIIQQVPQVQLPTCSSSYMDHQTLPMPGNMGNFASMVSENFAGLTFQENWIPSGASLAAPSIYGQEINNDNVTSGNSENSSKFSAMNDSSINQNSQNFGLDSVLYTPLSGSPLNLSTLVNCGSTSPTEDERDSYCSNLMKFEIPEILDFDAFM